MASTRLLQTVCTVAMLVGGSALAQPTKQPADTGPNTTVDKPAAHSGSRADMMGSPDKMMGRSGSHTAMEPHAGHGSAMTHPSRPMRGGSDTSQNDAVSRLNDQSYQAAQSGQSFNSGAGGMSQGGMGQGGMGAGGMGQGGMGAGGMGAGGMGAGGMGAGGAPSSQGRPSGMKY